MARAFAGRLAWRVMLDFEAQRAAMLSREVYDDLTRDLIEASAHAVVLTDEYNRTSLRPDGATGSDADRSMTARLPRLRSNQWRVKVNIPPLPRRRRRARRV